MICQPLRQRCCGIDTTHNAATDTQTLQIIACYAQDVAERVAREAVLRLYAPVVLPMDSYPLQQLPGERCVVCIAATTGQVCWVMCGWLVCWCSLNKCVRRPAYIAISTRRLRCLHQGDPPDNMRRFWKLLLRKSLPPDSLAGVHYAVFGLGDSGYVKYNVRASQQRQFGDALVVVAHAGA